MNGNESSSSSVDGADGVVVLMLQLVFLSFDTPILWLFTLLSVIVDNFLCLFVY